MNKIKDKDMKYKYKRVKEHGYIITEDGHTMFPEDVKRRLDEKEYIKQQSQKNLELAMQYQKENKELKDIISKVMGYNNYCINCKTRYTYIDCDLCNYNKLKHLAKELIGVSNG